MAAAHARYVHVKQAYLREKFDEELCIEFSSKIQQFPGVAVKANKAIYGLGQVGQ